MPVDIKCYAEIAEMMKNLHDPERWIIVFNPEVFDRFEKKTKNNA